MQTTSTSTTPSQTQPAAPLPLEDEVSDILSKAMKGRGLSVEELANRVSEATKDVETFLQSARPKESLEPIAFALGLHAQSLSAMVQNQWPMPHVDPVDGLAMMTTDLGYMTVNAYVIWDPETRQAVTFDTGATCDPLMQCILNKGLTVSHVYITHTHLDHVMDIVRLQEETGVHGYGPAIENPLGLRPLKPGDAFVVGNLKIKVLDTSGHTPGGLSYFITGLSHPIVVVGDALFAGSIGGAAAAYDQALRNLRDHVFTLPDETIVCPGHGPLTTIGHEKIWNPFFVEYKSRT